MEQDTTRVETSVGSLASIVAADGPLGFAEVLGMGADVADSLADRQGGGEAHGAVHPRAVVRGGEGAWVLTAPGLAAGTKPALAPELTDESPPTPEGDVFALGATLVFALTGQEFVDGALGASEPAGEAGAPVGAAATAAAGPLSLPDVMGLFLDTLRRTLANDPAVRGTAARLAGTLRQLRNEAERALAPPVIVDDPPTGRVLVGAGVGAGAAAMTVGTAAAAPGLIAVDGTTVATDPAKKSFKQRFPALLAVAAILVAFVLGGLLLRKDDKPTAELTATGPTTSATVLATSSVVPQTVIVVVTEAPTSSSSTSTTKPTTTTAPPATQPTAPPTIAPEVTVPPPPVGTVGMTVDMSQMISCAACPAPVRKEPSRYSQVLFSAPDKTVLWGQCWRKVPEGAMTVDGATSDVWVYVVGPLAPGYVSVLFVGRAIPGDLTECPPVPTSTTTPTTKAP